MLHPQWGLRYALIFILKCLLPKSPNSKHKHTVSAKWIIRFFEAFPLNRLSLDAPIICVIWQMILADALNVNLYWYHNFILGVSVWLCYSADRFMEYPLPRSESAQRYEVFKTSRRLFKILWTLALVLCVSLSFMCLSPLCLLFSFPLLLLCLLNFALCIQEMNLGKASYLFKELRTALILALGCVLFPIFERSMDTSGIAVFFFSLTYIFLLNCLFVSRWEQSKDRKRGRLSIIQQNPRLLEFLLSSKNIFSFFFFFLWLTNSHAINFFAFVFLVVVFVITLDFLTFREDEKRQLIDHVYWLVPLLLVLLVHAG